MHANDVFLFFKNYFWHQHIKTIQNVQTILNFNKKKFKFFGNAATAAFPNVPVVVLAGLSNYGRQNNLYAHFLSSTTNKLSDNLSNYDSTSANIASIKQIRGPIAVREANTSRSFQEQEVGHRVPWELVKVQSWGSLVDSKWPYFLRSTICHRRATRTCLFTSKR